MAVVEKEEVVEVAADLAGGIEAGVHGEAMLAGEGGGGVGKDADLDPPGGLQLAREPGCRLALLLELAAERAPLAPRLGERGPEHGRVDDAETEQR